ncbi:class I SAM-dependent methyltransferase [Thiocapsa marina]|uniref:Methyltransferase type 12 n=1 Tax=Thiocapsa marina 5811 TaxID=768671 RepID=F9U992_9GAMM|nr:class I SAM-dependent methyltransferase [Thiocapsa marina]EGV19350.1 Methyltransferase type 12 [Thiocapsa marina 5811]
MPTERALAEYYGNYYNSSCLSSRDDKVTFASVSRFAKHLAAKFVQYQSDSSISILDFGGGDGSISHAVAVELLKTCNRVDISVVDYTEHLIVPRDKRISISRKDNLAEISSEYSIVIASAIIEHLPKPRDTLSGLLERLKPGGVFYARTPYVVPLMTLLSPIGIKLDLTYPAHVHDLGQEFWESYFARVATPNSFRILQSKPSIVATNFREHFLTTLAAYLLKAPWYLIGRSYKFVGGWEVFVRKN